MPWAFTENKLKRTETWEFGTIILASSPPSHSVSQSLTASQQWIRNERDQIPVQRWLGPHRLPASYFSGPTWPGWKATVPSLRVGMQMGAHLLSGLNIEPSPAGVHGESQLFGNLLSSSTQGEFTQRVTEQASGRSKCQCRLQGAASLGAIPVPPFANWDLGRRT